MSSRDFDGAGLRPGAAVARAPGVCGALAQGVVGDTAFSVACPVDFFSRVRVELSVGRPGVAAPEGFEKTAAAVRRTLARLGQARVGASVRVGSPIPRGRGMGSSSADLCAAIAATGLALGRELEPEVIGQIALSVEPTGGVMLPGLALFDHRAGLAMERLGPPPPMEIVGLDFGGFSDFDVFGGLFGRWSGEEDRTAEALGLVRRGVAEGSAALVGRGATLAAEAAGRVLPRRRLAEVREFADSVGAVGVNVGYGNGGDGGAAGR